jgi:hypothetical protein
MAMVAALTPLAAFCASIDDLPPAVAASLPAEVSAVLEGGTTLAPYVLDAHVNPFYLQGDFDGDGRRDTAILVKNRASGKFGIAVFLAGGKSPIVLGAGKGFGNGSDDFSWMDAWSVQPKGPVRQGASNEPPPKLKGDALLVMHTESASALVYWNGKSFAWYQQGD